MNQEKLVEEKLLAPQVRCVKLVADVIPASITPLEQEFDDDAEEEPNLRRDKDEKGTITCEAGPSGLADVEVITWKGAKLKKKDNSQK